MTTTRPQPDTETTPPQRKSIPWRTVFWVVFLVCAIMAGWLKANQNRQARLDFERAQAERARLAEERYPLGVEAAERVSNLRISEGRSRRDLEIELNDGKPFDLSPPGESRQSTVWTDPASGRRFEFWFRDDEWTRMSSSWGGDANLPQPVLSQEIYSDGREMIRKMIVGFAFFFWLLLLAALVALTLLRGTLQATGAGTYAVALRPHCRVLADGLLATAIVCTLAWLAAPNYSITFKGVTSNDSLVFGTAMLVISVPIVAGMSWRRRMDGSRSTSGPLQYSLRTLLLLTTLVAVMFALAPFGYVVALYAAGGGGLYWLTRQMTQTEAIRPI